MIFRNSIRSVRMVRWGVTLVLWCVLVHPLVAQSTPEIDVYRIGRLWTGHGAPIDDAVMVVADGKIVTAGSRTSMELPPRARYHDFSHRVVIPGLILAESSIGAPEDNEFAVTPHLRVVDALDLFADHRALLSVGITTVQVSPGAQRLLPGQGAVIKLAGDLDSRVLRETERVRLILNSAAWNPPTIYEPPVGAVSEDRPLEPTRPQLASSLADAVAGLRALFDAAREVRGTELTDADRDILASLADVLRGQRSLRITAKSAAEMRAAARLIHDHAVSALLVDPQALTLMSAADEISFNAFEGFVLVPPSRPNAITNIPVPVPGEPRADEFWTAARWLADRGRLDQIAIGGIAANEVADVLWLAGLLRTGGLTEEQILQILTNNAAVLLGVNDRVGELTGGKDADFVVMSDNPFARGAQVVATYIDGREVYRAEAPSTAARPVVIRAGAVHTEHGPWAGAAIVVTGDKIAAVGTEVSLPPNAEVYSFPDAVIVPGFIDLSTELGLGGALRDRVELHTALADWIVSDDEAVRLVRQSGVTTVLVGSSRLPTPMMAIKLSDRPRVIRDPAALRFEVSGNLTTAETTLRRTLAQGKAYADQWSQYETEYAEYQRALAAYEAAQKTNAASPTEQQGANQDAADGAADGAGGQNAEQPAAEKTADQPQKPTEPTKPRAVPNMEPYRHVFAGKLPVMIVAQQANAIELAVKIAVDEFHLRTVIAGADEADLALEALRRDGLAVVVGPTLTSRRGEQTVNVPQTLATARIPFGFQSQAATGSARLPTAIGYATYRGLGTGDALRGATHEPARFLQLGQLGKLEAGYDADLVVLSGPPFDLGTEVLAVMIDGAWVFQREPKK